MFQKFIERPILSLVIAVITVVLGIIGIVTIPVSQYPNIAPPTVVVSASYPGANAQTILESVISPLEEEINGVEGMKYITSTATNDGAASITVIFNQGIDPDLAAVNVQNRVSRANGVLPAAVTRNGIITQKTENSFLMYASLVSESETYDEVFLQNYLKINMVPVLQRVEGVSKVEVYGAKDYAMRIWIKPYKLTNLGLTPMDISAAIQEQSLEGAPGALGQNTDQPIEYTITYSGRFKTVEEYENIVIKTEPNGTQLLLKDVADIELGGFSYSTASQTDGMPSITFGVSQLPNSNAQAINEALIKELDKLSKSFPNGLKVVMNYNTNDFLEASISQVQQTLIEAFLLVFLVVLLFLQDFRSTLIPLIAVPVSVVGSFFFLKLFGFSMNLLTLFALILGIGIVVDDAIVVVEAVHSKLEKGAASARDAAKQAMSEISGAIISMTLIMAAVFVPVMFIQGPAGVFYKQFGITVSIAVMISAINALTLSPALSAIFLKPIHGHNENNEKPKSLLQRFYAGFNKAFESLKNRYTKLVKLFIRQKWMSFGILGLFIFIIWGLTKFIPQGFVPSEDRAVIFMNMELPPGASLGRTMSALTQLSEGINELENVKEFSYTAGSNFFSGAGSGNALGFVVLKDWSDRSDENSDVNSIMDKLTVLAREVKDANILFFKPSSVPGYGEADGFEFQLVHKSSGELIELDRVAKDFSLQLSKRKEIQYNSASINTNFPQYELKVNVVRAKQLNVPINSIMGTLQGYFGGLYVADFNKFGKPYRVMVQTDPKHRKDENSLASVFIKSTTGNMVPLNTLVQFIPTTGPQMVSRFNLYNSVSFNGASSWDHSSGDAIRAIQEEAAKLPKNYGVEFSGITKEEIKSAGQAPIILALGILFTFFFLAAQYESLFLPFAVLLPLPIGVGGAFLFTSIGGLENNIYLQIAMLVLIGLMAKNSILIIEFAKHKREAGLSIIEAAVEGAKERLRPILMTAFAFILGLLPLVLANGVGAMGNRSIGTGAAGGLLVGTLLGVLVIPVMFVIFQGLQERFVPSKNK